MSRLEAKGVSFCVLSMSGTQFLDTVTGTRRRLMLAMLGAVGQAKREAMLEPQREGIASKPLQGAVCRQCGRRQIEGGRRQALRNRRPAGDRPASAYRNWVSGVRAGMRLPARQSVEQIHWP